MRTVGEEEGEELKVHSRLMTYLFRAGRGWGCRLSCGIWLPTEGDKVGAAGLEGKFSAWAASAGCHSSRLGSNATSSWKPSQIPPLPMDQGALSGSPLHSASDMGWQRNMRGRDRMALSVLFHVAQHIPMAGPPWVVRCLGRPLGYPWD